MLCVLISNYDTYSVIESLCCFVSHSSACLLNAWCCQVDENELAVDEDAAQLDPQRTPELLEISVDGDDVSALE